MTTQRLSRIAQPYAAGGQRCTHFSINHPNRCEVSETLPSGPNPKPPDKLRRRAIAYFRALA